MDKVSKGTYIIAAAAFLIIVAAIYFLFIFQKKPSTPSQDSTQAAVKQASEVDLANRPNVALVPTTDGASINIKITNMKYFDKIEYELTYLADNPQLPGQKIERGSTGTGIDAKAPEYKNQILLGTASKGVRSPDKNVSDGKLTLHMFKGETEYRSETQWNLVQVGATGTSTLSTQDFKFKFEFPLADQNYWLIAQDTVGIPDKSKNNQKIDPKNVALPIYGAFGVVSKFTKKAKISITLDKDINSPQLFQFVDNPDGGSWAKIDSNYDSTSKTLTAQVDSLGVFVVSSK